MSKLVNPHNVGAQVDAAIATIASSAHRETEGVINPNAEAYQQVAIGIAKISASLDAMARQLLPRQWEATIGFGAAVFAPQLVLDLPIALTWGTVIYNVLTLGNTNYDGAIGFFDQDGARLKFIWGAPGPFDGPTDFGGTQGIKFRKNLSVMPLTAAQAGSVPQFPFELLVGGIQLSA